MAAKRAGSSRALDDVSLSILRKLKDRFVQAGYGSRALASGYDGVPTKDLEVEVRADTGASQVDFDLSLKHLEESKWATTGPMVVYDNPPNSGAFILAVYSKREYVCLTEEGYRMAKSEAVHSSRVRSRSTQINISGGHFHQSQIAAGEQIAQQLTNLGAKEALQHLEDLLAQNAAHVSDETRADLKSLVAMAEEGNLKEGKTLFQKIFGFATETVKQAAWGILTALLAKSIGL